MVNYGAGIVVDKKVLCQDTCMLVLKGRSFSTINLWAFVKVDLNTSDGVSLGDDLWFEFGEYSGYVILDAVLIPNIEGFLNNLRLNSESK